MVSIASPIVVSIAASITGAVPANGNCRVVVSGDVVRFEPDCGKVSVDEMGFEDGVGINAAEPNCGSGGNVGNKTGVLPRVVWDLMGWEGE